jgi:hypothetical protein
MTDNLFEDPIETMLNEFAAKGLDSVIGRLVIKSVIERLPRIVAMGVKDAKLEIQLEDGRTIDLSAEVAEAIAAMPISGVPT